MSRRTHKSKVSVSKLGLPKALCVGSSALTKQLAEETIRVEKRADWKQLMGGIGNRQLDEEQIKNIKRANAAAYKARKEQEELQRMFERSRETT